MADKGQLSSLVNDLAERYPKNVTARTLDNLKDAGFYWSTRSGVTVAISDMTSNMDKNKIMEATRTQAAKVQAPVRQGSDRRRRAPLGARRHLDQGHGRGRRSDAGRHG